MAPNSPSARREIADEFLPTRNSLLSRLRRWEDETGWREFFETYWRFLFRLARRAGLDEEDARDVVQETVVGVAKGLREGRFQPGPGGSFKAWLQVIVRRRVADHLRRRQARPPSAGEGEAEDSEGRAVIEELPDPAGEVITVLWEEEWARHIADAALAAVKERVGARQFQMFDLYVLKSWKVGDVARLLHVHAAQVYLAKHRVTALLRQETAKLRARLVNGRPFDGCTTVGTIRSNPDIS